MKGKEEEDQGPSVVRRKTEMPKRTRSIKYNYLSIYYTRKRRRKEMFRVIKVPGQCSMVHSYGVRKKYRLIIRHHTYLV